MLQRFVPHAAEAAVLYARLPGEPSGPHSVAHLPLFPARRRQRPADACASSSAATRARNGNPPCISASTQAIAASTRDDLDRVPARGEVVRIALIGNQRAGALYRDGRRHITAALETRFDAIARSMTEFHYGRFDLRFASLDAFMRGEDFAIVEINGIGGEAIDCWDPRLDGGRGLSPAGRSAAAVVPDRRAQPRARLPPDRGRRISSPA